VESGDEVSRLEKGEINKYLARSVGYSCALRVVILLHIAWKYGNLASNLCTKKPLPRTLVLAVVLDIYTA